MLFRHRARKIHHREQDEDVSLQERDENVQPQKNNRNTNRQQGKEHQGHQIAGKHIGIQADRERKHAGEMADDSIGTISGARAGMGPAKCAA